MGEAVTLLLTWQHQITILRAGTWPNTFKTSLLSLRSSELWRLCLSQPCDGWRAVFGFTMLATQLILLRVLLLLVHPPGLLAELDEDEDHSWKNVLFFVVSVCVLRKFLQYSRRFFVKIDKIIGWINTPWSGGQTCLLRAFHVMLR